VKASSRNEGFTLLEVMMAVAILAVSLTAIFASQGGAIKVAHRARKVTVASTLARCKMGEIEEIILEEGFPAVELADEDECCEDAEVEGFTCDWIVERIELPEPGLEDDGTGENAIDALTQGDEGGDSPDPSDLAGAGSVEDVLSGAAGLGGGDMITEMAMSYAYPVLKPAFEEQIRRAKITVRWNEGGRSREFDVVQYLVNPPPAALPEDGT
jgi:general secretion pathway protein I